MSDLILRAPRAEDVDDIHAYISHPDVFNGTTFTPFTGRKWVEDRVPVTRPGVHSLVAEKDGHVIGWCTILRGENRLAHSAVLGLTVAPGCQGQGVGRALMTAILDLADNWLGLVRVELEVNHDNARAIHLYESLGFEIEGRKRARLLRNGVYVDSLMMARLRPAPAWEKEV